MTFAARAHTNAVAAAPAVQALGSMDLGGIAIDSDDFALAMTLNPDGTVSFINEMNSVQVTPGVTNWYAPTTPGVGAGYRVRFTLLTGTAWSGGLASGTLYTLDSSRTIFWNLPLSGTLAVQVLVEITSTANTTVLGSGTLYVNAYDEY